LANCNLSYNHVRVSTNWLVMVWRLPHGSSTPRVTTWRSLKRLGAASLTPGAALLPFRDDLLEQLGWMAQEVEEMGGDAWVLPVNQLTEVEEARVREQVNAEREAEYRELVQESLTLLARAGGQPPTNREMGALRRRLERIRGRDHYGAQGGLEAIRTIADLAKPPQRSTPSVALKES
jgi:hypothetical protein